MQLISEELDNKSIKMSIRIEKLVLSCLFWFPVVNIIVRFVTEFTFEPHQAIGPQPNNTDRQSGEI